MPRNVYQAHIQVKRQFAPAAIRPPAAMRDNVCMGKKPHQRRRQVFLRQWREFNNLTLVQVAESAGISHGQLSRIERGEQPYNEELLESLALLYGCDPVDMLTRNPGSAEPLWKIWEKADPTERDQITAIADTLVKYRHSD